MHEAAQHLVERMGLALEAEGLPRIAGRLLGFLLVHEGAFSLDDLADELQVSKASVSTNARQLEIYGLLERTSAPGDRRDYYQMGPDVWEKLLARWQQKWEAMRALFTEAAASLPEEMEAGRARLIRAEQFHLLMVDLADRASARWRERAVEGGRGAEEFAA
jgi:DNA-binding transcriptional regulator GbsR (MarR family)